MMFSGDIINYATILAKRWFEYLFDMDSEEFEDFYARFNYPDVEIHGWIKPKSRYSNWIDVSVGISDYKDDFPGQFYINYVSFERDDLFFFVDINTKNDLTTYSCLYAPDFKRKEWDTPHKEKITDIRELSGNLGIKMDKKESERFSEMLFKDL
jgi:hypothetical protein